LRKRLFAGLAVALLLCAAGSCNKLAGIDDLATGGCQSDADCHTLGQCTTAQCFDGGCLYGFAAPGEPCDGEARVCDGMGECVECIGDANCHDIFATFCSDDHRCVRCKDDHHCPAETPRCSPQGRCQECLQLLDCVKLYPEPDACRPLSSCTNGLCQFQTSDVGSFCNTSKEEPRYCDATSTCVECLKDEHCKPDPFGGYCVGGRCVDCRQDMDCPSSTPFCSKDNRCVLCAADTDCTLALPGACWKAVCLGDGACYAKPRQDEPCTTAEGMPGRCTFAGTCDVVP
jgi:hypothetical protein